MPAYRRMLDVYKRQGWPGVHTVRFVPAGNSMLLDFRPHRMRFRLRGAAGEECAGWGGCVLHFIP